MDFKQLFITAKDINVNRKGHYWSMNRDLIMFPLK